MMKKQFRGVYTALLTPRSTDGTIDLRTLRLLLRFQNARNITKFAVNGATGEFCLTSPEELKQILEAVRTECGDAAEILCGVGAAGSNQTDRLVRIAEQAGVNGLLLPMPYFFPYSQGDLKAYCTAVASGTMSPILLYNLPQFTTGLQADTVCDLIESTPNISGIKDSSGSLEILTALTERIPDACRIVGNDAALAPAIQEKVCDGVVSGVACVLPELIQQVFSGEPGTAALDRCSQHLTEFIEQLNVFPTPWGLKWAAQARGILQPHFALPLSKGRKAQAQAFQAWLNEHLAEWPLSWH